VGTNRKITADDDAADHSLKKQAGNLFCFEQSFSSPLNSLIAGESEGLHMNRRGVEFSLTQVEPGLWKWEFQIGDTVTIGKTQSNLMGMAARRVQQRIDRELGKPRDLAAWKVE
jgi:hypothetical protein